MSVKRLRIDTMQDALDEYYRNLLLTVSVDNTTSRNNKLTERCPLCKCSFYKGHRHNTEVCRLIQVSSIVDS